LGATVYLALIVLLSVLFAFLMLSPKETAHQLQRNGDSIIGMYAGKQTERYLVVLVLKWSLISGLLQAACMAVSLVLSLAGTIPMALSMIPASMMIIVSIVCSLIQEIGTYHRYDAYRFFM
jgi:preprotein translocase subunit SecY